MVENIYMLPSDMNLKIRLGTVEYNNKILVSNEKFSLRKNEKVNTPAQTAATHRDSNDGLTHAPTITHNEEPKTMKKLLWYWLLQVVLQYGMFL